VKLESTQTTLTSDYGRQDTSPCADYLHPFMLEKLVRLTLQDIGDKQVETKGHPKVGPKLYHFSPSAGG
ncbi:MAG: hypothetical protein RLZZ602_247, partial [Pseudomonadota bacterium]